MIKNTLITFFLLVLLSGLGSVGFDPAEKEFVVNEIKKRIIKIFLII